MGSNLHTKNIIMFNKIHGPGPQPPPHKTPPRVFLLFVSCFLASSYQTIIICLLLVFVLLLLLLPLLLVPDLQKKNPVSVSLVGTERPWPGTAMAGHGHGQLWLEPNIDTLIRLLWNGKPKSE